MSLLNEIDVQTRLKPLQTYLEGLEELGLDPNDEIVLPNIYQIVMDVCGADDETLKEAMGRSEWTASQEMMKGRGIKDPQVSRRRELADRLGANNPRIGLRSNTPQAGDYVKLAGGGGIGKVVSADNDSIRIRNKSGYEVDAPLRSFLPKSTKHPKTGQPITVWIERM